MSLHDLGFDFGPLIQAGTSIANSASEIERARQAAKAAGANANMAAINAAAERQRLMNQPAPAPVRRMSPLMKVLLGAAVLGVGYVGFRFIRRRSRR